MNQVLPRSVVIFRTFYRTLFSPSAYVIDRVIVYTVICLLLISLLPSLMAPPSYADSGKQAVQTRTIQTHTLVHTKEFPLLGQFGQSGQFGQLSAQSTRTIQNTQTNQNTPQNQGAAPPQARINFYESIYQGYRQQKNPSILQASIQRLSQQQGGKYLDEFVIFLQQKNDTAVHAVILQSLTQLGQYNTLYQLYFSEKENHANYRRLYKNIYYQTLSTIGERKILLMRIGETLAASEASIETKKKIDLEIQYLRALAGKETNQDFYRRTLSKMALQHSDGTSLLSEEKKFVIRSIMEHVLFYLKAYPELASILKTSDTDWTALEAYSEIKRFKLSIKYGFLNQLHALGQYDAYLDLVQALEPAINVNSQHLAEAAYLAKRSQYQTQYAPYSPKLQLKILFYDNAYRKAIELVDSIPTPNNATNPLHQHPYYILSLAAAGDWDAFNKLFFKLSIENQIDYLWIEPLFQNKIISQPETLLLVQSKEVPMLSPLELTYLNMRSDLKDVESIRQLHEIMRRILIKDKNLVMYLETHRKNIHPLLFAYGISEAARQYMERGEAKNNAEVFRKYYQALPETAFREKLFYFYAVTTFYDDPEAGREIFQRFLSVYPKSAYRQEITHTLMTILL